MNRPDRRANIARVKIERGERFTGLCCNGCGALYESDGHVPDVGCPKCGGTAFKPAPLQRVRTVKTWPDGRREVMHEDWSASDES